MSRDALIVGINTYQNLPDLGAAATDAEAMAQVLQTQGEFRVQRLPEVVAEGQRLAVGQRTAVTTQGLEDALIRLLKPPGNSAPSLALVYFSGHGLQREAGIREGYLATSDTNVAVGNFGISLSWLRRLIEDSPVRQIVVLLDCCHSGSIFNFKEANPGATEGCSRLFIAASREYEAAYESLDGHHSVLTKALLSGLDPNRVESGQISNHSLIDWVSHQLKSEVQQPLFECSGGEMILTRTTGFKPPKMQARLSTLARLKQLSYGFCPYRGIEPFTEKHADYFFGRDTLVQTLLEKIRRNNFCAVVGASSSGKTSLLRAGLIHQLQQGKQIPGSDAWQIRLLTPGKQPLRNLAAAFTSANVGEIDLAAQLSQAESILRGSENGLSQLITATFMHNRAAERSTQFWLVIDQLEELLSPTEQPYILEERQQFLRCLLAALCDPSLSFGLVVGVRADAMDGLLPYPELLSLIDNNLLLMTPIPYDQLRAVITKPAEKMGLQIDPLLLHTLTLDLTGAPGELALLQQTLLELWRRRQQSTFMSGAPLINLDAYISLGGIKNVLTSRATAVYENLAADEKQVAERIFLALCELGDGREDNKRRAYKSELINEKFSATRIEHTLEKLITARLVVVGQTKTEAPAPETGLSLPTVAWKTQQDKASEVKLWLVKNAPSIADEPTETIELAHKSLIQDWPMLRQWINTRRDVLRYQRHLENLAQEWQQRKRPKHPEYLLSSNRLQEALSFMVHYGQELSTLAQEFVMASRRAQRRLRLKTGALTMLVPLALLAGMAASMARHRLPGPWLKTPSAPEQSLTWSSTPAVNGAEPVIQVTAVEGKPNQPPKAQPDSGNFPVQSVLTQRALVQLSEGTQALLNAALPAVLRIPEASSSIVPFERTQLEPSSNTGHLSTLPPLTVESIVQIPDPSDPSKTIEVWVTRPQGLTGGQ
ncbi:MAG: caspase family protein [Cyanobacteria bacterium P01_G01_bin.38]